MSGLRLVHKGSRVSDVELHAFAAEAQAERNLREAEGLVRGTLAEATRLLREVKRRREQADAITAAVVILFAMWVLWWGLS